MKIQRISGILGAEVSEIDLAAPLSEDFVHHVYELLMRHQVLVFQNQNLTPAQHEAFALSFGPLTPPHPLYPGVEGHENIVVIPNDEEHPPENETWHSDYSFRQRPVFGSVLLPRLLPPQGGDTLFSSAVSVAQSLSEPMRGMLRNLNALHSLHTGFAFTQQGKDAERAAAFRALEESAEQACHPVLMAHPSTKKDIVYVNETFTSHILGVDEGESQALLAFIWKQFWKPRHQIRVRWQAGTVVLWDNFAVQHYASGDHFPAHRLMHRASILYDKRLSGAASEA